MLATGKTLFGHPTTLTTSLPSQMELDLDTYGPGGKIIRSRNEAAIEWHTEHFNETGPRSSLFPRQPPVNSPSPERRAQTPSLVVDGLDDANHILPSPPRPEDLAAAKVEDAGSDTEPETDADFPHLDDGEEEPVETQLLVKEEYCRVRLWRREQEAEIKKTESKDKKTGQEGEDTEVVESSQVDEREQREELPVGVKAEARESERGSEGLGVRVTDRPCMEYVFERLGPGWQTQGDGRMDGGRERSPSPCIQAAARKRGRDGDSESARKREKRVHQKSKVKMEPVE